MASTEARRRPLSFEEIMELTELAPSAEAAARGVARRFISRRPAWLPGSDIAAINNFSGRGKVLSRVPFAAFGGHVYCQAAMAVSRALESEEREGGFGGRGGNRRRFGLHTVHGYFNAFGMTDRPFVYDVTPVSTGRSVVAYTVMVRQPNDSTSSFSAGGESGSDRRFPLSDPSGHSDSDLGPVCFFAMVSLKLPEPHSAGLSLQEPSAQSRFSAVLASRPPTDWLPAPRLDLLGIVEAEDPREARELGTFPAVEMRKIDLRAYNDTQGRPLHEMRELILYRLFGPMPVRDGGADANAHALVHAYVGDRNGLLMAANFLGLARGGTKLVTSLSNTFVVHTNVDEAVLRHRSEPECDAAGGEWWLYEASYPRVANGRVILEGKIWSPKGVHVATVYQDGLLRAELGFKLDPRVKEKLSVHL